MAGLVSLAVMERKSSLIAGWCQWANLLPSAPQVIARRAHGARLRKACAHACDRLYVKLIGGFLLRYAGRELHLAGERSLQEIYECGQWLYELRRIRAFVAGPSYYMRQ